MQKSYQKPNILQLVAVIISLVMIILASFFLYTAPRYYLFAVYIIFGMLSFALVFINYDKHNTLVKILFVAIIFLSCCLITYIVLKFSGILSQITSAESVVDFIRSTEPFSGIIFVLFIVLNIVFLPVPTPVTAVVGAVLFGSILSFIYLAIGTLVGSIITFTLGKIFGVRLVEWMIGKQQTQKYSDTLAKKGKTFLILMMIFPFFPDDILCLVAGITSMTYKYFIFVICAVRIAVLGFMCFFAGGNVIPFSGWGIPVWCAIIGIFAVIFIVITIIKKHKPKSTN